MPGEPKTPATRSSRSNDLVTAAGVSVIAASVVGAAAAAGRAVHRDPGGSWVGRRKRGSGSGSGGAEMSSGASDAPSKAQQDGTTPSPDAAGKPEGPEDLHKRTWVYALKKTAKEFGADQCTDLAAALVYYSVLALGPSIVAIVSILGLLDRTTITGVLGVLAQALGEKSSSYTLISGLVNNASSAPAAGIGLVVGIAGALWSASGYVGAFGRAMNRIYSIPEGRPVWKLRPTQLAVTVVIVVLVVIGALLLVSTGPVVQQIADVIGVGDVAFTVFSIAKWPILAAIAIAAVAILYYFSPNVQQPKFKWISTGSILALVVWALATVALGLYIGQTGGSSYSKSYGPIAGVIIFLLWLWITNLVLLFGAEFDAELERSRELQAGIAAEEQIQLPLRDTRQSDKKAAKHQEDVDQARALRVSRGRED